MTDYQTWCESIKTLPLDEPTQRLKSANDIRVYRPEGYDGLLALKKIRPETKYVPRLKILGEVAYSLFDWHLNPAERVTPNVCPVDRTSLWREFIGGWPGEVWRGELYRQKQSLEAADLVIVDQILESRSAQRIALLDFIFLCQDRSARNWVECKGRFWGVDNGMLWAYKGRHTDKETILTGRVDHLRPPMEALVSTDRLFDFKIGIFSSLYAGNLVNDGLLMWLSQVDWGQYYRDLADIGCRPLEYPPMLLADWRFSQVQARAEWILRKRRFPMASEAYGDEWHMLTRWPLNGLKVWRRKWEITTSETS